MAADASCTGDVRHRPRLAGRYGARGHRRLVRPAGEGYPVRDEGAARLSTRPRPHRHTRPLHLPQTDAAGQVQAGVVDESDQDRLIAKTATDTAELLAMMRRERDRRRAAGQDTTWLDQAVPELEALVERANDLEVINAIKAVIARHGPRPYPPEELATIAGVDTDSVRRALVELVTAGLAVFLELRATRAADPTGSQAAVGLVNDRSDLPYRVTSFRRAVKDRVR